MGQTRWGQEVLDNKRGRSHQTLLLIEGGRADHQLLLCQIRAPGVDDLAENRPEPFPGAQRAATVLTLDDAMAEIADLGATGLEILGEGNIPGYPEPSTAWIDSWFALLQRHNLEPTNYGSWIDSRMWRDRDLTAEEGTAMLARDLKLAAQLGFTSLRPKIGVVSMDLRPHPIWEEVIERNLDLAADLNVVIMPEIHAPTPIKHPVVDDYIAFIERTGGSHFRLLIDTGIFQRAITSMTRSWISRFPGGRSWPPCWNRAGAATCRVSTKATARRTAAWSRSAASMPCCAAWRLTCRPLDRRPRIKKSCGVGWQQR